MITATLLLITLFFLLEINYFHCMFSLESTKLFHRIFNSVYIMLIFYASKWRYCRHRKGALSDSQYWSKSNILVSSEGIITLQKSSVFTYYFMGFKFVFCSKRKKTIQTVKTTIIMLFFLIMLEFLLLQDNDIFILLESLKKTWFSQIELCFET